MHPGKFGVPAHIGHTATIAPRKMAESSLADIKKCTVVICTRDRPAHLSRCLAAVKELDYPAFDVLVVDNAPKDEQTKRIAERMRVGYLRVPEPGQSRARTAGAKAASGEIIAYLDDDSICTPSWLKAIAAEFATEKTMAVTGKTLARNFPDDEGRYAVFDLGDHGIEFTQNTAFWFETANFGGMGNGMNMAFRSKAFRVWPGFDERLGRGTPIDTCDEHYAFFRLISLGWSVVYSPTAIVYHPFPKTREDVQQWHIRNLRSTAAYALFLFFEQPSYRRKVIIASREWIFGKDRTWGRVTNLPTVFRPAPRWKELVAAMTGPYLYAKAELQHRVHHKRYD